MPGKQSWIKKTKGKVLVPKVGQDKEFTQAFNNAVQIGQGKLGWQGQAELMYNLGLIEHIGFKLKGSKRQKIAAIKNYLITIAMEEIYTYGEWVPVKQAELRIKAKTILYGPKD